MRQLLQHSPGMVSEKGNEDTVPHPSPGVTKAKWELRLLPLPGSNEVLSSCPPLPYWNGIRESQLKLVYVRSRVSQCNIKMFRFQSKVPRHTKNYEDLKPNEKKTINRYQHKNDRC